MAVIIIVDLIHGDRSIEVTATMDDVTATSPAIVGIRYTLTNQSSVSGDVSCTARVDNPVGSGFATLTGYLGPNETKTYTNEIVVTNNGVAETRSASIECNQ